MEKGRAPFPWLRGSAALLVALLVIAIGLPNAGRVVVDPATPQTAHIEGRVRDSLIIIAMAVLPLFFILFLGRRWWFLEAIGWFLLVFLFVGAIFH
jgi:hypothetical protein